MSTMLRILEHCGLRNYKQLNEMLIEARNWGKEFFADYVKQFPNHFGDDVANVVSPSLILIMLIIAATTTSLLTRLLKDLVLIIKS